MAIKQIVIAGFGPFEYDDTDPDTPAAIVTTGTIEGDTVKGVTLEVDEVVTEIRVKAGGSITNDTGTYTIDDNQIKLVDGNKEVYLDASGLEIEDVVSSDKATLSSVQLRFDSPGSGSLLSLDKEKINILSFTALPFEFQGVAFKVTDFTDATSATDAALISSGGLAVAKTAWVGENHRVEGAVFHPSVGIVGIDDSDSPYTVPDDVSYIATDSSVGGILINLPTGTNGRRIVIFDYTASAPINAVTIDPAGTDTINGLPNIQLTTDYQSVTLVFFGGVWVVVAQ